jgi:hypothetical protein
MPMGPTLKRGDAQPILVAPMRRTSAPFAPWLLAMPTDERIAGESELIKPAATHARDDCFCKPRSPAIFICNFYLQFSLQHLEQV